MFEKIRERLERRKTVRAARRIAVNMYMLGGPDLRHLSDDELIEHLTRAHEQMAKVVKQAGVTLDDANDAFSRMGRAFEEMQRIPNAQAQLPPEQPQAAEGTQSAQRFGRSTAAICWGI